MTTTTGSAPATPGPATTARTAGAARSDATTPADHAPVVLGHAAGYACSRTIMIGLRHGLIAAVAERPGGIGADDLADQLGLDPFYVRVWCQGAVAAAICDRVGAAIVLAPHMNSILLDADSPAYAGGVFGVFEQPEIFDRFDTELPTGARLWWDECSADWIAGVSDTGTPFYTRLVGGGLQRVPGVHERLSEGCLVVDMACGTGIGLIAIARRYPVCRVLGVDGDAASIAAARRAVSVAGLSDRVTVTHSPVESMRSAEPAGVVINNISMHECRDIDAAARRVLDLLVPGGTFVISDFPFPDDDSGLRTVPGRIMAGIQYFEAQIDDQLLPRARYDDVLRRNGFVATGSVELTPMHALTHGRRP